jgi:quercetin dioxygenase-like cupin family protein
MKHVHYSDLKLDTPNVKGAKNVKLRWLINEKDGAKNFAMRYFEIEKGGYTPFEQHWNEQEMFILEGEGILLDKEKNEEKLKIGDVIFVPSWEWHQFVNTGSDVLKFICVIPLKND